MAVAADDPLSMPDNVVHIFDEIEQLTAADWDRPGSDLPSESTAVEKCSSGCFTPICHRVRDLRLCFATMMQDSKAKMSLEENYIKDTNPSPGSSEPSLSRITEGHKTRIHKTLFSTWGHLRKRHVHNEDAKPHITNVEPTIKESRQSEDIKVQDNRISGPLDDNSGNLLVKKEEGSGGDDSNQLKIIDTCPNQSVKARCGRIQKVFHGAMKLFHISKSKEFSADPEPESVSVEACYDREIKPRSRIRRALKKPFDLIRKQKTEGSTEETEPRLAIVKANPNEEHKPRCNKARRIIHQVFPCLRKKAETPEEQKISNEIDAIVDHFWDELKHYRAGTGISPTEFLKACEPLEPAVDKITRNLQKGILQAKEADKGSGTKEVDFSRMDCFNQGVVTDALVEGNLKPEMMQRLREGFDALVATAV